MADMQWKQDVSQQLQQINTKVLELALSVEKLTASQMTRKEIEDADNRRVSVDQYTSDQRAIGERLTRLEGYGARLLPWVALGVSVVTLGHTLRLW